MLLNKWNYLYLDLNGDHMGENVWKNDKAVHIKFVHFTVSKLYFNITVLK